MHPVRTVLAFAICVAGCGSKSPPTTSGTESLATGSASAAAQDSPDAAVDKAVADSAAAFEAWLAQFFVVAKSFDGKDCDAFVAQVKTLEPKLAAFVTPMKPYVDDPARMQKFDDALKPTFEAMKTAENKATSDNFVRGIETCAKHPELEGALARGMPRKKQ